MKTKIIALFTFSTLMFSCQNEIKDAKVEEVTTQEEHHHHDHESEAIQMDNGKKWKVNDDMMVHIQNMEKDVNSFESKSGADYASLAKKVETNIELLTSSCTMEGQAHEELHKWLLPFIELSNGLTKSKSEQESAEYFQKIKDSMSTFHTYFE